MSKDKTLLSMLPEMKHFVLGNLKLVDEVLAESPVMTEEAKEMFEALEQSLRINSALIAALEQHPILMRKILNKK